MYNPETVESLLARHQRPTAGHSAVQERRPHAVKTLLQKVRKSG
jgi:hypothetical protein